MDFMVDLFLMGIIAVGCLGVLFLIILLLCLVISFAFCGIRDLIKEWGDK